MPLQTRSSSELSQLIKNTVGDVMQNIRTEVSKELQSATAERDALQATRDGMASGRARDAVTKQLRDAEAKVEKLQAAVDKLDRATTNTGGGGGTLVPPVSPRPAKDLPGDVIIPVFGIIFVGFPLALAFARILWKRGTHVAAPAPSQLPAESTRRFDHLEQSVDAIAIEVERISENQRYLTKLLSESRQNVAVGSGRGGPPPTS